MIILNGGDNPTVGVPAAHMRPNTAFLPLESALEPRTGRPGPKQPLAADPEEP